MSRGFTPITDALFEYVRAVSVREPEALKQQRLETDAHPHAGMQTAPEQGQFLQLLARMVGAKKALEWACFWDTVPPGWLSRSLPVERSSRAT